MDAAAGRRNTAVLLGRRGANAALVAVLLAENAFVQAHFGHSWPLRSFSAGSLALLGVSRMVVGHTPQPFMRPVNTMRSGWCLLVGESCSAAPGDAQKLWLPSPRGPSGNRNEKS